MTYFWACLLVDNINCVFPMVNLKPYILIETWVISYYLFLGLFIIDKKPMISIVFYIIKCQTLNPNWNMNYWTKIVDINRVSHCKSFTS